MFNKIILMALMISSLVASNDILKQSDSFRTPFLSSVFNMKISSYKDKELVDEYHINGQVSINEEGASKTLIYFTSPEVVKNRKMLINDNYIWIMFPRTKNAIRLSPMQILLGEVSNGDIVRISFSADYKVEKIEDEVIDGTTFKKLFLTVKESSKGSTYQFVNLSVDKNDFAPKKAMFYSNTHKLIKTAIFSEPIRLKSGKKFIKKVEIFDAIYKNKHSSLEYTAIAEEKINSNHYNKNYLTRLRKSKIKNNEI